MNPNQLVNCEDIKGNITQVPIKDLSFRPAVYGVVVKDNQVLLSKQWDGHDFPGGGIKLGETIEEALIREVKEETGIDVKPKQIIFAGGSFFKLPFGGKCVQSIHLYYLCEYLGGKLTTKYFAQDEKKYAQLAEWVDINKLNQIKLINSAADVGVIMQVLKSSQLKRNYQTSGKN